MSSSNGKSYLNKIDMNIQVNLSNLIVTGLILLYPL